MQRGEANDAGGAEAGGPAAVKNVSQDESLRRIVNNATCFLDTYLLKITRSQLFCGLFIFMNRLRGFQL